MNILTSFVGLDWAEKIGITLIHSFWQVALIAIIYALVRFLLRLGSARARYTAGCCALFAMLVAPVSTYLVLWNSQAEVAYSIERSNQDARGTELSTIPNHAGESVAATPPTESTPVTASGADAGEVTASMRSTPVANTSERPPTVDFMKAFRSCLPWVTTVWVVGVSVLSLRPFWGWLHLLRVRRHGLSPLPEALQIGTQHTMRRLGVHRAVRFVQSALVEVPTVVGFLKPIVLLPASIVFELSTEEIELILAHELAHVRRNDWIVNLAQVAVEALLFYHPAMWWVSGQIRAEREHCCDDIAVATEGRRAAYVRTLVHLEELRQTAPVAVLSATGSSLIARVRRLSGKPAGNCGHPGFRVCVAAPTVLTIAAISIAVAMATGGTEGKSPSDGTQQEVASYSSAGDSQTDADAASRTIREGTFKLIVRDAQGNPVPYAKVNHSRIDRDKKRTHYSRTANEQGIVVLDTTKPENIGWFSFSVKTAGYAPFYGKWNNWDANDMPPNEFTVRLKKGKTIGGVIKNEQGEPVEGVEVSFSFPYGENGMRRDDRTHCSARGTSDADGHWTCGYVPADLRGRQRFTLNHPDYKTSQFNVPLSELLIDD
ncbi:MAG: M56 family metallopeptidase, partial [Pirellulaceae bacterium]